MTTADKAYIQAVSASLESAQEDAALQAALQASRMSARAEEQSRQASMEDAAHEAAIREASRLSLALHQAEAAAHEAGQQADPDPTFAAAPDFASPPVDPERAIAFGRTLDECHKSFQELVAVVMSLPDGERKECARRALDRMFWGMEMVATAVFM